MALYINDTGVLRELKEMPFKLEKDLQKVFEPNLLGIMGLELVKSECIISYRSVSPPNETLVCHVSHATNNSKGCVS